MQLLLLLLTVCLAFVARINATPSPSTSPTVSICGCDEVSYEDINAIKQVTAEVVGLDGFKMGVLARLAFHEAGSLDTNNVLETRTNGCFNDDGPLTENSGLAEAKSLGNQIMSHATVVSIQERINLSKADIWQIAAISAIEKAFLLTVLHDSVVRHANPRPVLNIPFRYGRVDYEQLTPADDECPSLERGNLPMAETGFEGVKLFFKDKHGFSIEHLVAILGIHTLGTADPSFSGYDGKWTIHFNWFDNQYYLDLLDQKWDKVTTVHEANGVPREFHQWNSQQDNLFMLNTDMALVYDVEDNAANCETTDPNDGGTLCNEHGPSSGSDAEEALDWVKRFARGLDYPNGDKTDGLRVYIPVFEEAYQKMSEMGYAEGELRELCFGPPDLTCSAPTPAPSISPSRDPTASPSKAPTGAPSQLPTRSPTMAPTGSPSSVPSATPTSSPSASPTAHPTGGPSASPTAHPTSAPSSSPTTSPTAHPTASPTKGPTGAPSTSPTASPTQDPTRAPTASPTAQPTKDPTRAPSMAPTTSPTASPTAFPTRDPTKAPSTSPTTSPTAGPTAFPTKDPTKAPSSSPTTSPTASPTAFPTKDPTKAPSSSPTTSPTASPTAFPTKDPTKAPSSSPTSSPTASPTTYPSKSPTHSPSQSPTRSPTQSPTRFPSASPSKSPTRAPTSKPTRSPTYSPTSSPSKGPTTSPTASPSRHPTTSPTRGPTSSPTGGPTPAPSPPTSSPTGQPTANPSPEPTATPSLSPTTGPTGAPTKTRRPTSSPSTMPPTMAPETPDYIAISTATFVARFEGSFDEDMHNKQETRLKLGKAIADALGLSSDRVTVVSMKSGSIIVTFEVDMETNDPNAERYRATAEDVENSLARNLNPDTVEEYGLGEIQSVVREDPINNSPPTDPPATDHTLAVGLGAGAAVCAAALVAIVYRARQKRAAALPQTILTQRMSNDIYIVEEEESQGEPDAEHGGISGDMRTEGGASAGDGAPSKTQSPGYMENLSSKEDSEGVHDSVGSLTESDFSSDESTLDGWVTNTSVRRLKRGSNNSFKSHTKIALGFSGEPPSSVKRHTTNQHDEPYA